MKTYGALIYLPGYPFTVETLVPDRTLAACAASILAADHFVTIFDHGVLGTLERLLPPENRADVETLADAVLLPGTGLPGLGASWRMRGLRKGVRLRMEALAREAAREVCRQTPQWVGIQIRRWEDTQSAIALAGEIRKRLPDTFVLAMGKYAACFAAPLLARVAEFDAILIGEGETALPILAQNLKSGADLFETPNLMIRAGRDLVTTGEWYEPELERLQPPDYTAGVYPALHDGGKLRLFTVEDSRGCPTKCQSCTHVQHHDGVVRLKSVRSVREEIAHVAQMFGSRTFHFTGNSTPAAHLDALARDMISSGAAIRYARSGSIRHSAMAIFANLRASGCESFSARVDTGSQMMLDDYYGKGFGVSETEAMLRACRQAGLYTITRFTYPTPMDDYHSEAETLRLIERARPHLVLAMPPELPPDSQWMRESAHFGFRVDSEAYHRHALGERPLLGVPVHPWEGETFRADGKPWRKVIQDLDTLQREIIKRGVATTGCERLALMARMSAATGTEDEFALAFTRGLLTGDAIAVGEMMVEFNARATTPENAIMFRPFVPVLAAVGN